MDDWIKMRSDLYRDPKVLVIADVLMRDDGELARYVNQNRQRDMTVTRNVMRNVTVGALVSVWGVMRRRGKRDGDNLVALRVTLSVLDDIADLPGFGEAMAASGWVQEVDSGLVFPNFFQEHNSDPTERKLENARERQRRYRERHAGVTGGATVTHREEKRREEKSKKKTPLPPFTFDDLSWPAGLDGPEARQALTEWLAYKRTRGETYKTPVGVNKLLARFRTHDDLRAAVDHSIAQNYVGCFPPSNGKPKPRTDNTGSPAGTPGRGNL